METRAVSSAHFTLQLPRDWPADVVQKQIIHFIDPDTQWIGHGVRVRARSRNELPHLLSNITARRVGEIETSAGRSAVLEVTQIFNKNERAWCALLPGPNGVRVELVVMPLSDNEYITEETAIDMLQDVAQGLSF